MSKNWEKIKKNKNILIFKILFRFLPCFGLRTSEMNASLYADFPYLSGLLLLQGVQKLID